MRSRSYIWIFLLSLAANLFQALYVLRPQDSIYSDMQMYLEWAQRLADGGPIRTLDLFYPSGTSVFYSIFLSALAPASALTAIAVFQATGLAAANVLIGLTAQTLFRSTRIGIWSAVAAAAYWPLAVLGSFFIAEPFFIFFAMLGQYLAASALFRNGERRSCLLRLFSGGICFAIASLLKTQGAVFLITAWLLSFRRRDARLAAPLALLLGFAVGSIPQFRFYEGRLIGAGGANDAFALYVGQSRRQGVGTFDPESGEFYVFYNNNSRVEYLFRPTEILIGSILNREMFMRKVSELWNESPARQVLWSLQNAAELWFVRASWPLENNPQFRTPDMIFQWLGLLLLTWPAWAAFILQPSIRRENAQMLFLVLPLFGITAVALIGNGQSRYLLPYYYNVIALAFLGYSRMALRFRDVSLVRRRRALAVASFILVLAAGKLLGEFYIRTIPPRLPLPQGDYRTLSSLEPRPAENGVLAWTELGRGESSLVRVSHPSVSVDSAGFARATETGRPVSWAVEAPENGTLSVAVPEANSATRLFIALYMIDPDSYARVSLVSSGGRSAVAQDLHNGRWVSLEVLPEEFSVGRKAIRLQRLLGSSVLVSAVVVYRADEGAA